MGCEPVCFEKKKSSSVTCLQREHTMSRGRLPVTHFPLINPSGRPVHARVHRMQPVRAGACRCSFAAPINPIFVPSQLAHTRRTQRGPSGPHPHRMPNMLVRPLLFSSHPAWFCAGWLDPRSNPPAACACPSGLHNFRSVFPPLLPHVSNHSLHGLHHLLPRIHLCFPLIKLTTTPPAPPAAARAEQRKRAHYFAARRTRPARPGKPATLLA